MAFSQKTVYALRAVFELSMREGAGPIPITLIAEAQGIPPRFLENILIQLKQAGLVESVRGKDGGYRLAKSPKLLSVGHVLRAVEGQLHPVACLGATVDTCPMRADCVFLPMWERAMHAMLDVYDATTFEGLVADAKRNKEGYVPSFTI